VAALCSTPARAAVLEPELARWLQSKETGEAVPVIVTVPHTTDPSDFRNGDRHLRRARLLRALYQEAAGSAAKVARFAEERGATRVTLLWAAHAVALSADPELLRSLAAFPDVESIRRDARVRLFPEPRRAGTVHGERPGFPARPKPRVAYAHAGSATQLLDWTGFATTWEQSAVAAPPERNLVTIKAPDLWTLGFSGQGVVVASLDTGVDVNHPDLAAQYRGGSNSWFDPYGEHPTPADLDGHGTHTMSVIVGRDHGGTVIGVAPNARWIAAKVFNDAGYSRESFLHQSLQWVLDPDGDPETDDAPDIVNLSWSIAGPNVCNQHFQDELDLLRSSDIAVVIAGGNSGPSASTSISPANNPGTLSVGSVSPTLTVSTFSSRGPSACGHGNFPAIFAPGEEVRVADLSFGGMPVYKTVTGTSFAAPHVAGALALLMSAAPTIPLSVLESALKATTVSVEQHDSQAPKGAGLIDTLAAYQAVAKTGDIGARP